MQLQAEHREHDPALVLCDCRCCVYAISPGDSKSGRKFAGEVKHDCVPAAIWISFQIH